MINFFDDFDDKEHADNCLFTDVLNIHAPVRPVKLTKVKTRPNPYITPEIKHLTNTRDLWRKKAIKTMDKLHWNACRFSRQEVKREICIAEQEYVRSELTNSKGNTNSIWKVINCCIRKKNAEIATSEDPMAQANMYNEFYTSVGKTSAEMAQTLTEKLGFTALGNNSQSNEDMSKCSSHQEFYFRPVTEPETLKLVKALPSNKAPGADKVTARILKASLPVTLPRLTNLINCPFRSGIFAESWKLTEVVPCIKDQ